VRHPRLGGCEAGEVEIDDVAGGADGGIRVEMIDQRPGGRDKAGAPTAAVAA
jgi:hypothetical protein